MSTRTMVGRMVIVGLGVLLALTWLAPSAHAAEAIKAYQVAATIEPDGTLQVSATVTFAGAAPETFRQQFQTRIRTAEQLEYRYEITDISVTSANSKLETKVSSDQTGMTIETDTAGINTPIQIDYTVKGAAWATAERTTTVSWPLLQGLDQTVETFDGTIQALAQFTMVDCAAGNPIDPGACVYYGGGTHESPAPFFHDENRAPGDVVIATVRFPSEAVAANQQVRELWTPERAFSVARLPLGVAAGLLALGGLGLWVIYRRLGRDATDHGTAVPTPVAEFAAVGAGVNEFRVIDGVSPGEVGTLVDEHVDAFDITATVLDLAVRGHLLITEEPGDSVFAATDWAFTRLENDEPLLEYERTLLDAIAPAEGPQVRVLGMAASVVPVIAEVQSELYDEVVTRGWFARRPDSTRNHWVRLGWAALVVAVLAGIGLIGFTRFGLAGLVLIGLALGLLLLAQAMPSRTAAGSSILAGLDALRGLLLVQPTESVDPGRAYTGLSRILPYAIVLGGKERWLQALVDADTDDDEDATDLDWYHGPKGWQLSDLPASLANFVTTVQGVLFSR